MKNTRGGRASSIREWSWSPRSSLHSRTAGRVNLSILEFRVLLLHTFLLYLFYRMREWLKFNPSRRTCASSGVAPVFQGVVPRERLLTGSSGAWGGAAPTFTTRVKHYWNPLRYNNLEMHANTLNRLHLLKAVHFCLVGYLTRHVEGARPWICHAVLTFGYVSLSAINQPLNLHYLLPSLYTKHTYAFSILYNFFSQNPNHCWHEVPQRREQLN